MIEGFVFTFILVILQPDSCEPKLTECIVCVLFIDLVTSAARSLFACLRYFICLMLCLCPHTSIDLLFWVYVCVHVASSVKSRRTVSTRMVHSSRLKSWNAAHFHHFGWIVDGEGPPALWKWQKRKLLEMKIVYNCELYICFIFIYWWSNVGGNALLVNLVANLRQSAQWMYSTHYPAEKYHTTPGHRSRRSLPTMVVSELRHSINGLHVSLSPDCSWCCIISAWMCMNG